MRHVHRRGRSQGDAGLHVGRASEASVNEHEAPCASRPRPGGGPRRSYVVGDAVRVHARPAPGCRPAPRVPPVGGGLLAEAGAADAQDQRQSLRGAADERHLERSRMCADALKEQVDSGVCKHRRTSHIRLLRQQSYLLPHHLDSSHARPPAFQVHCYILALDSLQWNTSRSMDLVEGILNDFKGIANDVDDEVSRVDAALAKKVKVKVTLQANDYDCGIHALEYADTIAHVMATDSAGTLMPVMTCGGV